MKNFFGVFPEKNKNKRELGQKKFLCDKNYYTKNVWEIKKEEEDTKHWDAHWEAEI